VISMLQPTKTEGGQARLTTKIVTKRLKSGEIKRYRYYQLVKTYRKGKRVKSQYVRYIGKEPPPRAHIGVAANQDQDRLDVAANQASAPPDVAANRDVARPPPPLDLEVIEPEGKGLGVWSFPRHRATCRRCGGRFEMIKFEVELGHYLCPRCRAEIIKLGERSSWPGY